MEHINNEFFTENYEQSLIKNKTSSIFEMYTGIKPEIQGHKPPTSDYPKVSYTKYEEICSQEFSCYSKLNKTTRKFLVSAEFMLNTVPNLDKIDYSPIIAEYCKALETEMKKSIFSRYIDKLIIEKDSIENVITSFLKKDLESYKDPSQSTSPGNLFAFRIKKAKSSDVFLTLGEMTHILYDLKDQNKLHESNLLKDFEEKLKKDFVTTEILSDIFLTDIDELRDEIRNKAVHSHVMPYIDINDCKKRIDKKLTALINAKFKISI